jgi:hypothetical protein
MFSFHVKDMYFCLSVLMNDITIDDLVQVVKFRLVVHYLVLHCQ